MIAQQALSQLKRTFHQTRITRTDVGDHGDYCGFPCQMGKTVKPPFEKISSLQPYPLYEQGVSYANRRVVYRFG
jgi:hypothetical protein